MKRIPHAVRGAYDFADDTKPCPTCKADPYVWCTTPEGRVRWMPCVARLQAPLDVETETDHPDIDPYQVQLSRGDTKPLLEQVRESRER